MLIEQGRSEMENGTDPTGERTQRLARRWRELVREFTEGDAWIESFLGSVWRQEKSVHSMETAPMREMGEYVSRAVAASQDLE